MQDLLGVANVDPGFDVSHTVMATVWRATGHGSPTKRLEMAGRSNTSRDGVPGVIGVTSIGTLPFMGELPQDPIRRKGDPISSARDAYSMGAGEQFCKVLGIPILRGRDFDIADRTRHRYRLWWTRRWRGDCSAMPTRWGPSSWQDGERRVLEIIGVIADTKMRTLGEDHAPMFFTPYEDTQMIVRTAGDAGHWIKPLRETLAQRRPARHSMSGHCQTLRQTPSSRCGWQRGSWAP